MNVLFATSELNPLIKVGGLADVAASLPPALRQCGHDVRIIMPLYREIAHRIGVAQHCFIPYAPGIGGRVDVFVTCIDEQRLPLYLVDAPSCFGTSSSPYATPGGSFEEAERWLAFGYAVASLARHGDGRGWRPDLVHGNDWPCGFAHALLAAQADRTATVFTVHNLAHRGLFDSAFLAAKGLPSAWWHSDALEFHGQLALIKCGLVWADTITTVSPRYAREIMTPESGCGLDGLLRHREHAVVGILNGVDYATWDPAHDRHLVAPYSAQDLSGKARCRADVRARFDLIDDTRPLLVSVGRLAAQKGIELLIDAMPELAARAVDLILLGSGDSRTEAVLRELAVQHASWFKLVLGFDDVLAHRLEAAGDLFLMPSLYEPCGLNQLYSLRYGTPPVVHATGGLADTVVDANPHSLADGNATGFCFAPATSAALLEAIDRALDLCRVDAAWGSVTRDIENAASPLHWRQLQLSGMRQDFSWQRSARRYSALYRALERVPRAA